MTTIKFIVGQRDVWNKILNYVHLESLSNVIYLCNTTINYTNNFHNNRFKYLKCGMYGCIQMDDADGVEFIRKNFKKLVRTDGGTVMYLGIKGATLIKTPLASQPDKQKKNIMNLKTHCGRCQMYLQLTKLILQKM